MSFKPGRRFRVIKDGASLVHGDFGESGGRIDLAVGAVLVFRSWSSNFDGDSSAIWMLPEGIAPQAIEPTYSPYDFSWAEFHPRREIGDQPSPGAGWCFFWPDPDYLEPIDEDGEAVPW